MPSTRTWFILALVVQALIVAAVPASQIWAKLTGRKVVLKVAPVDPYDVLSGYYVTLRYPIADGVLGKAGIGSWDDQTVYVLLKEGADGIWIVESASTYRSDSPPAGSVWIKGKNGWRGVEFGIETYYIPEDARESIAEDLRGHPNEARAEVYVDSSGNAALHRLIIQDRVYQY
jgi:uncharacterized membrane-anchored protein